MLIFASDSSTGFYILKQAGFEPNFLLTPTVDNQDLSQDSPTIFSRRLACQKASIALKQNPNAIVLSCGKVASCGKKILHIPKSIEDATKCLKMISGRRHTIYASACLLTNGAEPIIKTTKTIVKFKRLHESEISAYISSKEWYGEVGAYSIQGKASCFVSWVSGSFSSMIGVPIFESSQMLKSIGIHPNYQQT